MKSAQETWEAALGELQLQVNKPNYQTWFKGTRGLAYQEFLGGEINGLYGDGDGYESDPGCCMRVLRR